MHSVFITGTDTGVGKTVVAAALLAAARAAGMDAVPMKPVQTGCAPTSDPGSVPDLDFCLAMAGWAPAPAERALLCPYPLQPPCSPHLAAAMAGRRISIPRIAYRFGRLAAAHDAVVVEGAGGVLAPLNERETMLDLMRALRLPVLLVVRPGLGTLNHTLLSLGALRGAGVRAAGLVVVHTSRPRADEWIRRDNLQTLESRGGVPVLAELPHCPHLRSHPADRDGFLRDTGGAARQLAERLWPATAGAPANAAAARR